MGKNECTIQRMHVQNHAHAKKSRHKYVCEICQLLNPNSWNEKHLLIGQNVCF